jgi:hypothetical protein
MPLSGAHPLPSAPASRLLPGCFVFRGLAEGCGISARHHLDALHRLVSRERVQVFSKRVKQGLNSEISWQKLAPKKFISH